MNMVFAGIALMGNRLTAKASPLERRNKESLMNDIRTKVHGFVHKYIKVSAEDENVIVDYALKTWSHPEGRIKYLQFLGDYGTGTTRAGKVMKAICSKPVVSNGASSPATIIAMIDAEFPCTLILDEADMIGVVDIDEAEDDEVEAHPIVKLLSAGAMSGGYIVRMVGTEAELKPASFNVYGYKVLLSRSEFADNAIQSRCIPVRLNGVSRRDIQPVLADEFEQDSENIFWDLLDHFHRL